MNEPRKRRRQKYVARTSEKPRPLCESQPCPCAGLLETHPKGYGFLRTSGPEYERHDTDIFVPQSLVAAHALRQGCFVAGDAIGGRLTEVVTVNGTPPEKRMRQHRFDELTPTSPRRWMRLEHADGPISLRMLDLMTPIGFGQRALIAAPPRGGKTMLLQQIGQGVATNYPSAKLITLLIDERPEEITDMSEELPAEAYASSLDSPIANHARLARIVIDRCQRLVEEGRDVVLLVDSLTRMTRAFNKLPGQSNMMGPGGIRVDSLEFPRTLFASARAFKEFSGTLTIIATVLVGTDNRMDDVIYREFKGTGNTDLVLDSQLADRAIWPALDLRQSATRRSERIQDPMTHRAACSLRRSLVTLPPAEAITELARNLARFESNEAFVVFINETMKTAVSSR